MSGVIGFRLDPENPREAQALQVLEHGRAAGYSTRHILTEALLALEAAAGEENTAQALAEMAGQLAQIQDALERLRNVAPNPARSEDSQAGDPSALFESFVESVKSAAKPGVTLDKV